MRRNFSFKQQCEGCDEKKQFIVKENQLLFSCGAKSGKCGPQIIINFKDVEVNFRQHCQMVHQHVLIAAYGLCHPDWSSALIESQNTEKH